MTASRPITRDDIEARFRDIQGDVEERTEQAVGLATAVGVAVVVGIVIVAFVLGRRGGRKRTTVVEIRRV